MPTEDASGRLISDDGAWWWDGNAWQPTDRTMNSPPAVDDATQSKAGGWRGVMNSAKSMAETAKVKAQEHAEARAQVQAQQKAAQQQARAQEQAAREAAAAEHAARRQRAFEAARETCPLPISPDVIALPGGLSLFQDEFLVSTARDWGWSSQQLLLTTQRLIHTHGRMTKDQQAVYLTDIRDVGFRKPLVGYGTLAIETAGGHSIEGLPAVKNGREQRDRLMQLIHWARQRAQQPQQVIQTAPSAPDKFDQLRKLADLKAAGALSDEEFEREKAKLLG